MIGTIAYKELRTLWRDGRARWLCAILLTTLCISAAVGIHSYSQRVEAREAAERSQRDQWLHKTAANAHVAAHEGIVLFRPVSPLSVLDSGTDPFLGTSVYLEPHRRNLFAHAQFETVPPLGRFAELTMAVTLQTVVPLVIILVVFPAFAAEREQGTLRHVVSLGVRPRTLALGKAIGLSVPISAITIPPMLLGLFLLITRGAIDIARAFPLVLAYVIYFLLFLIVGIAMSLKARSSQHALIGLLGFWFVTCFLVPRTAFVVAQRYERAPTAQEFMEELGHIDRDVQGFLEHRAAIEKRLLVEYHVRTAEELPVSTWGVTLFEREVESTGRYNEQFARLFDAYRRQQRLVDIISIASPPLALRTLSMALTGTDVAHFRDFAEATERYRYELVQGMNQVAVESRLYNSSPNLTAAPDQPAFPEGERAAYERIGAFKYELPTATWAMSQAWLSIVSLLAWLLVSSGAALAFLRRVEVL